MNIMESKCFKFVCLTGGLYLGTLTLINVINIMSAFNVSRETVEEKQTIGFKGE